MSTASQDKSTSSDPYFSLSSPSELVANYGKTPKSTSSKKSSELNAAAADHPDRELLDFGIGENDSMADQAIRDVMSQEINQPENRGYADNGVSEFKQAAARFMKRRFDVQLDPETQINHCIGSKPAYAMLPACFINPGDITLITVPGYPVAATHTRYYGGEVFNLPLLAENNFMPDLDSVPDDIYQKPDLVLDIPITYRKNGNG